MTPTRRDLLTAAAAGAGLMATPDWLQAAEAGTAASLKVLRYAFPAAETGFDPVQLSDLYSHTITAHIFETLLEYDHLARPFLIRPCTAVALPEIADDHRTFTLKIRPGIRFHDDPAFKGQPRELTAEDYVYTLKRYYDPATKSPGHTSLEEQGIVGLQALRDAAIQSKQPFDYNQPVEGAQALDRYTLRFRLRESRPRFLYTLAGMEAMAREVVEFYGDKVMEHPVGTGPFRLAEWRRSSMIVMERFTGYRERFYDATPNADDTEGRALLARFKGRRIPMLDRVEVSIIEEAQPRWLAFLNGEQDLLERVPADYIPQALVKGELAPHLAKKGIRKYRIAGSDVTMTVFNMEDPLVGGLAPQQVALRRAISLGLDIQREIRLGRRGEAMPAQAGIQPGTYGHDPALRTEIGTYQPARARALLDTWGYVDRDGDGWRERPDGSKLTLVILTQADQTSRQLDEIYKKNMDTLGLKVELKVGQWSENLKSTRAGKFMVWRVGSSAGSPDGQGALECGYSASVGKGNMARFQLPAFDQVYDRITALPDGPERLAAFREANRLLLAYAPYRFHVHRLITDLTQPQVIGYRRAPFWLTWWPYIDIEAQKAPTPK
ncbi:ABC transporter substrate-binding protein [Sphaerotilus sp.]|uniref:ABC transporter substrate-binding protein n=1 Tax=Sphaerotilus sp. TaxID=2093942 RepID=UPI0034E24188